MNLIYTMPNILTETSEGTTAHSLQDELFKDRQIELVGEITQESAYAIILQLRYLQKAAPTAPVTVYINSPGGEVSSGLALYDVMQAVKCPVHTVCVGTAASMAAILFASGKKRGILPHGKVMIHDPLIGRTGGSALQLQAVSRGLMATREHLASILAEHTGHSLEEIYEKTMRDTYFDAEEAVAFGLADRVITQI